MILGTKKMFVINEFAVNDFAISKIQIHVCNPMGNDPFQRNTSLYPEIRFKRVRYREARLYSTLHCASS